jgi:Leucine-rich repeat (LRR) protein
MRKMVGKKLERDDKLAKSMSKFMLTQVRKAPTVLSIRQPSSRTTNAYVHYGSKRIYKNEGQILTFLERKIAIQPHMVRIEQFHVTEINLNNHNLQRIPNIIQKLTHLRRIELNNNHLKDVPKSIRYLRKLREIHLKGNQIRKVPDWLRRIRFLTDLDFSFNPLEVIPDIFNHMRYLQYFAVNDTLLSALPPGLAHCPRLRELHCKNTKIGSLPIDFGTSHHLRIINQNTLPEEITEIPAKERWAVAEMGLHARIQINVLDRHVVFLKISQFHGESLSSSLGEFSQLKELVLADNRLNVLPPSIGRLKKLQILDVSFNNLTQIPEEMVQCRQLVQLDLSWNRIHQLPPWFQLLSSLRHLYLSGTGLKKFEVLANLEQITELALDSNVLTDLPPNSLAVKTIRRLNLSYNQFTHIPEIVRKCTALEALKLNLNRIRVLPHWIGELTTLQTLDLSDNRLTTLNPALIQLPRLTYLNLERNPWSVFTYRHIIGPAFRDQPLNPNSLMVHPSLRHSPTEIFQIPMNNSSFDVITSQLNQLRTSLTNREEWAVVDAWTEEDIEEWDIHASDLDMGEFSDDNPDDFDVFEELDDESNEDPVNAYYPTQELRPAGSYDGETIKAQLTRYVNQIPLIIEKIAQNQPLDEFDADFPEYAKYLGQLMESCALYKNSTAAAFFRILESTGLIRNGNFQLWL